MMTNDVRGDIMTAIKFGTLLTRAMYQGALIALGYNPGSAELDQLAEISDGPADVTAAIDAARKTPADKRTPAGMMTAMVGVLEARKAARR